MNTTINFDGKEIWFITGSQALYGEKILKQVFENSQIISEEFNQSNLIDVKIICKKPVKSSNEVLKICEDANYSKSCIGIITWMHTFSPAKMWISGLSILIKPIMHLHTQFNYEIPWEEIDMDFMNLNQSAHGDREFGFIMSRMRIGRKVVVGHWKEKAVLKKIGIWARVAMGVNEARNLQVARLGDNMREVAVTEGDKVSAQISIGCSVNGFDSSDVTDRMAKFRNKQVEDLVAIYENSYLISKKLKKNGEMRSSLFESARIELALRDFLAEGKFNAFTNTFENLGKLKQLPGIAVQRLMSEGYGFGAEGDWKTAALVRILKVMSHGLTGGTSFMEDYTYHFGANKSYVLGSHMLEICPSICVEKPKCEIHPLGIGAKEDPVRLVFDSKPCNAINVSLIDVGNRFRIIVNEVEGVRPLSDLPKLPVARAFWEPKPNLSTAASCWILAGGAHHTAYSQAITTEYIEDFAEILGIELVTIDDKSTIGSFKEKLKLNEVYYHIFNNKL